MYNDLISEEYDTALFQIVGESLTKYLPNGSVLSAWGIGNNVLQNKTAIPTRLLYFQLLTCSYLFGVFLNCSGFALVPR